MAKSREAYERLGNEANGAEDPRLIHSQTVPQPTAVMPSPATTNPRQTYKKRLYELGIVECFLGVFSLALAIVSVILEKRRLPYDLFHFPHLLTYTSQGVWAGLFFIVTGILGICTRKRPSVSMYKATMTLSIITAVFSGVAVLLSGLASSASPTYTSVFALHVILTILLFIGFIISIVHSAFCCAGTCGANQGHPDTVVYIPQVLQHQQIGGIPSIQYVVPAGTFIPQQSGPLIVSSTGEEGDTNPQMQPPTTQATTSRAVFNETLESSPGYSTLPKQ